MLSSGHVLSSLTLPSLISSFDFILIINDFVLFILFIMLPRFLTQITDTFSGSWSFGASTCLNYCFPDTLLKAFTKTFCAGMLLFFCCFSNIGIMFFKQLCHITLKLRPIITLKYLVVFKCTTFITYCLQRRYILSWCLGLKGSFYLAS